MPRGDGTGPAGRGPMTGRAAGYCNGYNVPGYMNPVGRPGMGMRFGRGHGFRGGHGRGFRRFYPPVSPVNVNAPQPAPYYNSSMSGQDEVNYLENTAKALEEELSAVRERLDELKKE